MKCQLAHHARTSRGPSGLPSYWSLVNCASSRSGGEATVDLTSTRTMTNPQRKTTAKLNRRPRRIRWGSRTGAGGPKKSAPQSVWHLSFPYSRRPQACICWRKVGKDRQPSQCSPHSLVGTPLRHKCLLGQSTVVGPQHHSHPTLQSLPSLPSRSSLLPHSLLHVRRLPSSVHPP